MASRNLMDLHPASRERLRQPSRTQRSKCLRRRTKEEGDTARVTARDIASRRLANS